MGACDNWTWATNNHVINWAKAGTALVFFTGMVIPNAVLITVLVRGLLRGGKSIPRLFVLAIACTDLSAGCFATGHATFEHLFGNCAAGGFTGCKYRAFMTYLFFIASQLCVVCSALERMLALKLPFKYHLLVNFKSAFIVLAGVVGYALLFTTIPFMGVVEIKQKFSISCQYDWHDQRPLAQAYTYLTVIQGFFLIAVLVFSNLAVLQELYRMRRRTADLMPSGKKEEMKKEREFAILMIVTSMFFLICLTPYLVRTVMNQQGMDMDKDKDFVAKRLYIANSMINPHLYWAFRASSRARLWRFIKKHVLGKIMPGKQEITQVSTIQGTGTVSTGLPVSTTGVAPVVSNC
ncbi:prostacyclin receptor-like [Branchiostoma lanceolatum]|uniref:PTGER4 protein n=1 Tax=Branchiostoma lanceolatum TaxID=7740 RepID=A0A8K0EC56_BRALA|nr:PTGER4 [Branchiostoma lanceolatum]